jgi:tRNA 2-thiouridine synthesizing protein A
MSDESGEAILDARGLKCPLPVLKARRALKDLPAGGLLRILATDPGASKDFAHFCETTGCQMVESGSEGEILSFLLRKPGA